MEDTTNRDVEDKLSKILHRLHDQKEQASNALLKVLEAAGLDIRDLRVRVASVQGNRMWASYNAVEEARELRAQLATYQSAFGLSWANFVCACNKRGFDTTKRNWRRDMAARLRDGSDYTLRNYQKWDRVPEALINEVLAMPEQDAPTPGQQRQAERYREALGVVVDGLRAAGLTPREAGTWVRQLLDNQAGQPIGLNNPPGNGHVPHTASR